MTPGQARRETAGDLVLDHLPPGGEPQRLPMLFVHGLWAGAWLWERWLPIAAARGWDAWALELRGRNGSRPVADLGKVGISDLVDDVRDALTHIGDAVLVGHSMGGLVAQVVAAEDPHVRAAAFLCSVPPAGIPAVSGPVIRRAPRYIPAMATGGLIRQRRSDAVAVIMNRMTPAERDAAFPRFIADSGTVARQIALGRVRVDARRVTCPVLVGGATDDVISPASIHPKLVAKYGAESLVFQGRGHLITLEEGWAMRANAVLDWAERTAGAIRDRPPE